MSQQVSPIGEKPLTRYEAQQLVERIRKGVDLLRSLLIELRDREGWKALGYDSWRSCVVGEFGKSEAYLYRQLAAARVENNLKEAASRGEISPIGEKPIPEGVIRPLAKLPDEEQPVAWDITRDEYGPEPTGKQVKQVVKSLTEPPKVSPMGEKQREAKPARPVVEDAKVIDEQPREPKPPHPKKHTTPADTDAEAFKKAAPYIYNLLKSINTKDIYGSLSAEEFQALASRIIRRLESKAKATRHVADDPPPLDVVLAFASEQDLSKEEAERFFYHHESTGWMAGRKWMTDWHAALRFWISNSAKFSSNNGDNDKPRSYEIKDEIF